MPRHFVCYMQRDRITDWKRKSLTRDDSAFIYGSSAAPIFSQIRQGDVLWVVSPVPERPPEIVARLDVCIAAKREDPRLNVSQKLLEKFPGFTWFARGDETSRYFGHNNAECALMQSTFLTPLGKPWSLTERSAHWRSEYGKRFQGPVELSADCAALFKDITDQPAIFISWKWSENCDWVIRDLAFNLADCGFNVWLDQLAMPASESLRRMEKFPEALQRLLRDGYSHSSVILAIEGERYGIKTRGSAKNWTLDEWRGALSRRQPILRCIFRPCYGRPSKVLVDCDYRLQSSDPIEAARELKAWYERMVTR
jgi:hypothetical protein